MRTPSRRASSVLAIAALQFAWWGASGCASAGKASGSEASPAARNAGGSVALEHTRFSLANGLDVVVHESRAAPIVAVEVWFRVGARHDPDGLSGLAHLIEHTMAQGTRRAAPREFIDLVQRHGALSNASTSEDRTVFFTVAPSNLLETVLWYEADRLSDPLSGLTPDGLAAELAAIRNERIIRYETPLYGVANEVTVAALFPPGHAYHRSPFGTETELGRATIDVLRAFARDNYRPSNATLVIAGDVDAARVRPLIEKYFGWIESGPAPAVRLPSPFIPLGNERRFVLEDQRAQGPRLRLAWIAPSTRDPAKGAAQMLAKVLGGGRGSMLHQELVTNSSLATQATAAHFDLEESGIFQIDVTARAGASLGDIERTIDGVIARAIAGEIDPARVRAAIADSAVASVAGLQLMKARADLLGEGAVFHDDPAAALRARETFARVTVADVRDAAARYLVPGRMVMSMVPAGRLDMVSKPELSFENVTPVRR